MATPRDTYTIPNTAIPAGATINSVTVNIRVGGSIAGCRAAPVLRVGSTDYLGTITTLPNNYWTDLTKTWYTNPAGGSWTPSNINGIEPGMAMDYKFLWPYSYPCFCTQIELVTDYTYTPPAGGLPVTLRKVVE